MQMQGIEDDIRTDPALCDTLPAAPFCPGQKGAAGRVSQSAKSVLISSSIPLGMNAAIMHYAPF